MQEQQGRFRSLLVGREVAANAGLFLAAEGRIGQDHVHPVPVADLRQLDGQAVAIGDPWRSQPVQEQVHLGEHVGERLGLAAEDAPLLQDLQVLDRLALLFQVGVRLDQEPGRAAGRVKDSLAKLGIERLDHEPDHGPGRVELAGIARRIPHLPQHGFVQMAEGVDFLGRAEVDAIDQVDYVAEQVAGDHAVHDAAKDVGNHVAPPIAIAALQGPEVGEQPWPAIAVRPHGLVVVDEPNEFLARDAILLRRPVAPAVGGFDGGAVLLASEFRFDFLAPAPSRRGTSGT